ncbi:MAG: tetratricopeptide repeat protein [Bacteroidales bacterium]
MNKFLRYIFVFCSLMLCETLFAQNLIDYNQIKEKVVHTSCTENSLDSVELTLKNLLEIDTLKISDGHYQYCYDLGMTYFVKAFMYEQKEFVNQTIASFNKCISIDKKNGSAYMNLAIIYHANKQFELAKTNLKLYKKYTRKKYWDKETIKELEEELIKF